MSKSKRHTYSPRDKKGNDMGITIEYEFEPEQLERGQFGRMEDATPPFPATVTINKVLCVERDLTEFLDSLDIDWSKLEDRILNQHDDR